jgi:hypothetical protein
MWNNPLKLPKLTEKDKQRFQSKIRVIKNNCWNWTDKLNSEGRALFWKGKHYYMASRIAWLLAYGYDPGKFLVCHICDNGACVNSKHLFLGTHIDNMIDRDIKKRTLRGDNHPSSHLTVKDVLNIRRIYKQGGISQRTLANIFNISQLHISRIIRKKSWSHV